MEIYSTQFFAFENEKKFQRYFPSFDSFANSHNDATNVCMKKNTGNYSQNVDILSPVRCDKKKEK